MYNGLSRAPKTAQFALESRQVPVISFESKVSHSDLVAFADKRVNLKREDVETERAQVNRVRERLAEYISEHPDFDLVKMLNAGSLAKGTALKTINDADVAVYVKAGKAPGNERALIAWLEMRLREAYSNLPSDRFKAKHHCVTISFSGTGLDIDVVPVLREDGDPVDDGYLVTSAGKRVLTNIPKHLEFIRKRKNANPEHFRQIVRFMKWWKRQQVSNNGSFRCKSFLLELIVAYLFDNGLDGSNYPSALEAVFKYIVTSGLRSPISFADYYKPSQLPKNDTSLMRIYDPVNPHNNIVARYTDRDRLAIVAAAQDSLEAIVYAGFATTKAIAVEQWRRVFGPSFEA